MTDKEMTEEQRESKFKQLIEEAKEGDIFFDQCECESWDGEDRRCSCGNRRVSWAYDFDSNGMMYVYGEAY